MKVIVNILFAELGDDVYWFVNRPALDNWLAEHPDANTVPPGGEKEVRLMSLLRLPSSCWLMPKPDKATPAMP